MAKTQTDKYANVMLGSVTESGANTLTFSQMPQVTTLLEKKAFLLSRIDYVKNDALLAANTDALSYGLSLSNQWTSPSLAEPSIIDHHSWVVVDHGAAANAIVASGIETYDLSTLPGGGILIPTRPLYLYAMGTNLGGASTIRVKIFFTIIELTPQDYWDLVESLQAYS